MSRFLTPSKVALLCLISIYTEGVIPNSSAVHVLSFLVASLSPLDTDPSSSENWKAQYSASITDLEGALSTHSSSIPGRTIWDLFLKKVWSIDSCDALEVFFSNLLDLLVKSREEQIRDRDNGLAPELGCMRLSRCSPLGAFVRRAQLEFTRLQFHDSVKLWKGFVKYRLPTYHAWARRNPFGEQAMVDMNLLELGLDTGSQLAQVAYGNIEDDLEEDNYVSTKDVERLLEFQIGELQRMGGRVPDGMKACLERIITSGATLPNLIHYLRFLDAWRAGDYPSSFDNLHRYFDYTMHSRDRSSYQYALLNLAILQADFGCYGEAVSAMQEAVSIARESHDMNCLNFCMSWLYHFGKAFPEQMKDVQNTGMLGNEKEGLAFLKAKAKETEMWSLLSTTLLSEAKFELQNVRFYLHSSLSLTPQSSHNKVVLKKPRFQINTGHSSLECCSLDDKYIEYLLSQLQAIQLPDNDITALLGFLHVEHLIRQGNCTRALEIVERTAQTTHRDNFDIHCQVKLLCLKACILEKTSQPQRGFSLAMRAANIAYRSRFLPGLWEAICALSGVLLSLREFEAVVAMVESIMPQILESSDCALAARAYSLLVDANMGIAGKARSRGSGQNVEFMNRALEYLDCAYDQYEKIGDIKGQCEMVAKKATVMHLTGDLVLANDYAAKYLDLQRLGSTER
ncbi:anaphase-promoting complex subunit 5-domain-containing protein [Aspergillus transmontanensis]|uniref:Anaphase-promoting complex subunit 5 n=1 Tax=Aspergillus transmontanensis TaxID=1034304 RepID=A0A5N6W4E1_9EURO|nr:anaphase-promoting complex subunit 5-domain-containing protein [Aspergillus transmontanensis]